MSVKGDAIAARQLYIARTKPKILAAHAVLEQLETAGQLVLRAGQRVTAICTDFAAFLSVVPADDERAAAIADWLTDQPEVAELFADDETIEALLPVWDTRETMFAQPLTHGARHLELEASCIANPDDALVFTAYSDWLQEQGDPLGELIAHQLAASHGDVNAERRAEVHLAEHNSYFCGTDALLRAEFSWHWGFLRSVVMPVVNKLPDRCRELMSLPTSRLLHSLSFEGAKDSHLAAYRDALAVVCSEPRPSIRRLGLGCDVDAPRTISSARTGIVPSLKALSAALPELRELAIEGSQAQLDRVAFERVETLDLNVEQLVGDPNAIRNAQLPRLKSLSLCLRKAGDSEKRIPREAPRLRRLSLRGNGGAADLSLLSEEPVLAQLDVLDVSACQLQNDEGRRLLALHAKFTGPRHLVFSNNRFDVAIKEALRRAFGKAIEL